MALPLPPVYSDAMRLDAMLRQLPSSLVDSLEALASTAQRICGTSLSIVTITNNATLRIVACSDDASCQNLDDCPFCLQAIASQEVLVVPDASTDSRFASHPLVTSEPFVRACASAPLTVADGRTIGALCVLDVEARTFSDLELEALQVLGGAAATQLELEHERRARRVSDAHLKVLTDSARVGFAVVNADRVYVYANDTYGEMVGFEASDLIGKSLEDILGGIYHDQVAPQIDRAFDGESVRYEVRGRDSAPRHFEVCYEPTMLEGSRFVLGVITDVTESRLARQTFDRLSAIVESSGDAIISKDLHGIVTSWNQGAEGLFGYTSDEMIGASIRRLIPSARQAEEFDILRRIGRGEVIDHFETQRLTKAGELIDVSVTVSPVKDANGRIVGASKVARDVSARKRAEKDLRIAEERMRFALESANIGIWDVDYPSGELTWSGTLERLYGIGPGHFEGTLDAFINRIHPDDRAAMQDAMAHAMVTGDDFEIEHRTILPDGSVRTMIGSGRIMLDAGGRAHRGIGIAMDITERRKLEEQYRQAQKMEAIGRLAGGVAHDFNNLLTAILGYCELLMDEHAVDEQDHADILEIQKAGELAASLTSQLLAFGRRQIIEPVLLNLNDIVNGMTDMMARLIGADVKVNLNLQPDLASIEADRSQIEQVIMNLAVNARDAMPRGGTLTIETSNIDLDDEYARTHIQASPGPYVVLVVSDTGVGMSRQVQSRLFEPFFTTKEAGKGTGLGLATVHGIVLRFGGSIGVYSEEDRGTTFRVYFPRKDGDATDVSHVQGQSPSTQGSETVLVVEDTDSLRALAERQLRRHGYVVLSASNAQEAQDLFDAHDDIDLVLTDVVMGGGTGPELVTRLRRQRPGLRVIFMSGFTEESITEQHMLREGVSFLQKPFSAASLTRKVREALDGPQGKSSSD